MKQTILIVEDVLSVRELMQVQLELRGYQVRAAHDGVEALSLVAQEKPAAIITDILMPRMDGFTLAYQLRRNPESADIPILFLSATYVSPDDERFALELGALRFFPKPVNTEDLFQALEEALHTAVEPRPKQSDREFYMGYRYRLKSKLSQKDQQIARLQRQIETLAEHQRALYRQQILEAEAQRTEIQRELDTLSNVLNNLE